MPTFRKTADIELRELKGCLLKLIEDLTARADRALEAPAGEAAAQHPNQERSTVYREQALTLRYVLEAVESMDPVTEESKFKSVVLMAASKASLAARKNR